MAHRQTRKDEKQKPDRPLLRRADQATVAVLILLALAGMGVYWVVQGGARGELIEIDRAEPLAAKFLVDINKAEWAELAELPEIGPTLAKRIVATRSSRGPYRDHEDLRRVRGIGALTLQRIKPYLLPMPQRASVAGTPGARGGKL